MKIIKYIIILIFVILIGDRILSFAIEKIYEGTYTGQTGGKINDFLRNQQNTSILAVGNSRCAHHIIPNQLNKTAYNLSHNGMNLVFHTGLVDQLINNESKHFDTLLLHIELNEAFESDSHNPNDIQHLKYFYNQNDWIKKKINDLSRFESIKYLFSSYRWNGKLLSVISNRLKTKLSGTPINGYDPKPVHERDSINVEHSHKKNLAGKQDSLRIRINNNFLSYINHIKTLCQTQKTTLICFTSPVYQPNQERKQQSNILELYLQKQNITFLNYYFEYDTNTEIQNIWNWNDNSHLNEKGAVILTKKIKKDLLQSY